MPECVDETALKASAGMWKWTAVYLPVFEDAVSEIFQIFENYSHAFFPSHAMALPFKSMEER
ncbi:MAG: hypothetical protein ACO1NO_06385 [Burkholderiaceae bacterium]